MLRKLGRSGITVSALGLGCWAIGGPFFGPDGNPIGWGEVDDAESIRAIHCALDLGINFFDTADVYGTGHSEEMLARALAGRRDQVVISSKFGFTYDRALRQSTGADASAAYIRAACEASLQRLNTDYIDLYFFHINDFDPEQAVDVRETLESLVGEGKIRSYGWSTDFPERAQVFADGAHCTATQYEMNVLQDAPEMVEVCEQNNLASILRGPLAMGLLTGKYNAESVLGDDDVRGRQSPDWMKYFRNGKPDAFWMDRLAAIREILTSENRTLAQGALAWLWARSETTIPIPGFRTVQQVEDNCGALLAGPLAFEQMVEIDALLDR